MYSKRVLLVTCIVLNQIYISFQEGDYTVAGANKYIAENKNKVNQRYRLEYHFMPPIGWINDPNGFIYYKGEYHLFYQLNPYDTIHNKIHWGHAKSKDLVHWEDLPVALAPDQIYDIDGIFSGSAIEKDGQLYLMYTGYSKVSGQVQCIAVSDDGITFTKIQQNPVLEASSLPSNAQREDFRDPKVFKRGDTYYVVIASKTRRDTGQILLYQSPDLINWKFKSILLEGTDQMGIMWECPDLFELDGKDVLLLSPIEMPRSGNDYHNYDSVVEFIGLVNWETGKFIVEQSKELDHGMDVYATQSLLDNNSRRIVIAWMSMWKRSYPTHALQHNWVGAMTIPRQLRLTGDFLTQTPANDLSSIYKTTTEYKQIVVKNEIKEFNGVSGNAGILDIVVRLEPNAFFSIELFKSGSEKTLITYDAKENLLELNRRESGILVTGVEIPPVHSRKVRVPFLDKSTLKLKILLDKSSIEIFANDGVETMTSNIYPTNENSVGISFGVHGKGVIESLKFLHSGSWILTSTSVIIIFTLIVSYLINI